MNVLELVARETRRALRSARIVGTVLPFVMAGALLTAGAIWLARGRWMSLPPVLPFLIWGVALVLMVVAGHRIRRRLAERSSSASVAHAIEEEQQLRRGALTGLLEVAPQGGVFVENASNALGHSLRDVAARPAPRFTRQRRVAAAFSVIALVQVTLLATNSFATRADGWRALLNPMDAWRGTLLPALVIDALPRRLARGGAAPIGVAAAGRSTVTVHWRSTGGAWRDTLLSVSPDGRANFTLAAVDADVALVANDGRRTSDTAHVRVVDRPFVGDVTIRATYPAYIGRVAERLAADAPIRIPAGTRLEIAGQSSEPLEAVALRALTSERDASNGAVVSLIAAGTAFRGRMTPAASGVWEWEARGLRQEIADLPPALEIDVIADSVPRVEILSPVGEVLVGTSDRVTLDVLAQDDHALNGVWIRRSVVDTKGVQSEPTSLPLSGARESEWIGGASFDLALMGLEPGMSVRLQAFARDAAPGSAREGVSATLVLRVPTLDEERRAAREVGDAAVASALAAARAQAQIAEQTATAAQTRTDRSGESKAGRQGSPDQKAMGFENAEAAKEIAEQQRALQERVAGLEEAAREMEDRLRRAGALDTALARQLQDAQKLLREAMTPEMQAALQKLESSTQQLDGDRTRQSLSELAQQQQQLRRALEKSAQMLKRAALEGSMQTLADQAKEMAQQQQEFADRAAESVPDTTRASELGRRTRELGKSLEALRQRLAEERAGTGERETKRAGDATERSESALERAEQQAREANSPQGAAQRQQAQASARHAAEEAAREMQDAAASMEKARSGQVSEWKGELTNALDQSVQEMMQLAREQDQLAEQARQDPSNPELRSKQSALQQGVQTAQQRLQQEARKSALVSPRTEQMMEQAKQQVAQATRESAEGQQRGGQSQAMQEAANSLRQAAAQLTRDRDRAARAQSASGLPEMMQQLKQLAQQQGALNGQMQSLFPTPQQGSPPKGLDAAGRAQARALARSQREVAQQLDEVADADPTGRAQELAREARMLAQSLDQGAVDPATQARQERLFRRMLDAGRSLEQEQKDESQRRESRAARGTARFTPPDGPARGRDAARYTVPTWEELRGLSADERRLVIEYFRRLNAEAKP